MISAARCAGILYTGRRQLAKDQCGGCECAKRSASCLAGSSPAEHKPSSLSLSLSLTHQHVPPLPTGPRSSGRPFTDSLSTTSSAARSSSLSSTSSHRHHHHTLRRRKSVARAIAFVSAVISSLCAGSITVFSLYGHIFQERLHYTQLQVNGVAIGSSVALYLPVPFLGYVCDRFGTKPLSAFAALLFGLGYGLAAFIYRQIEDRNSRNGDPVPPPGSPAPPRAGQEEQGGPDIPADGDLVRAHRRRHVRHVPHRRGYLRQEFRQGPAQGPRARHAHRRLRAERHVAVPGGQPRVYERLPGGERGDVDVFRFFVFLACLLVAVGVAGAFTLRVVDEQDLIDDAIEELENSGFLDGGPLLANRSNGTGYGSINGAAAAGVDTDDEAAALLDPAKDLDDGDDDDAQWKKNWVLNAETRRFLADKTLWCFALGFLLMIGPGEAFINNLGTVIGTLYPPNTFARLLTGSLTDLLAPTPHTQHVQVAGGPSASTSAQPGRRFTVSRVAFLLAFGVVLSAGLLTLASGVVQNHGERFWIVSSLVGAGYGAVFSLTPIIITVIWGVENFATNWGIVAMFPALGSTFWGIVYSKVYERGAQNSPSLGDAQDDIFCYGHQCYATTFWAMTISTNPGTFVIH
ncbi:unnamed protein product [Parascedosporium putredinis]|uniref:Probable transporter MCH1 n=1 Tax=Parascedosporium putredinis TaxID=1442378 RepID=A0A9P1HBK0_9PEZI|nr:unnamed protein product [Parascedosporium putredinis]CAI8004988.1 unnamed protein product [Parascedosporium putredinis]